MLSRNLVIKSILSNTWNVYKFGLTKNNEFFIVYRNSFPTNLIRSSKSEDGIFWTVEDIINSEFLDPSIFIEENAVHVSAGKGDQTYSPKHIQRITSWEQITSFSDSSDSRILSQVLISNSGGSSLFVSSASGRLYTSNDFGVTWTERRPAGDVSKEWRSIDSDYDGSFLIAGAYNGRLYTSNDFGVTWTERRPDGDINRNWSAICSSTDGSHLVAGAYFKRLYTSSDFGVTWTERQPKGNIDANWFSAASSSDGSRIIVGEADTGRIYTSSDYGETWTERRPAGDISKDWRSVSSSTDGAHLVVVAVAGRIYTSSDYGETWTERRPVGDIDRNWVSVASDSDGSNLIVGGTGDIDGRLYTSSDYGETWTERLPAGDVSKKWYSCASDADGSHLIVGAYYSGRVYTSGDYGETWTETRPAGDVDKSWRSCSNSSRNKYIIFKNETGSKIGCVKWVGLNWGSRLDINPESGWVFINFSACGGNDGFFYIVYLTRNLSDPTQNKIQARKFDPLTYTWGTEYTLASFCVPVEGVNYPRVRQLQNGEIWAIWSRYDDFSNSQIYVSKYLENDSWSEPEKITNSNSHSTYYDITEHKGNVIVVYSNLGASESYPNIYNIVYKRKLETWSNETLLTNQDKDQISPELIIKDGNVYCSYWSWDSTSSMYDVYVGKLQQSYSGNIGINFGLSSVYNFKDIDMLDYKGCIPINISLLSSYNFNNNNIDNLYYIGIIPSNISLSSNYSFSKNIKISFHNELDGKLSIRLFKTS